MCRVLNRPPRKVSYDLTTQNPHRAAAQPEHAAGRLKTAQLSVNPLTMALGVK